MTRQRIPAWTEIVAAARAEAQHNPQAFVNGAYAGETYATHALNHAASEGFADETYGSLYEIGYEVAVFRLTPQDAQTLDYRNHQGELLSRFTLVRDEEGKAQAQAYETDRELEIFISVIDDAFATHEAECEQQTAAHDRSKPTATHRQDQLL